MARPKITVGMAHYMDFDGVWFSIQAMRLYQDVENVEFLIIDNGPPDDPHSVEVRGFVQNANTRANPIRYVPFHDSTGTTQTREALFKHAEGEIVMVMDCHVLLQGNGLHYLKNFWDTLDEAGKKDLYTGPLIMDTLGFQMTHFELEWRGEMWGTWATAWRSPDGVLMVGKNIDNTLHMRRLNTDEPWMKSDIAWPGHEDVLVSHGFKMAGWDQDKEPFEIPAQGLGMFISAKEHWMGFNPNFRSFGGEEGYIHTKYRQAGRKAMCLPSMRWLHRFGRPGGPKYPITVEGKMRNYIIGFQELGLDVEPIRKHFVEESSVTPQMWDLAIADPVGFDPNNNELRKQHPNTFLHNPAPEYKSNNGLPLPLVWDNLQHIALFLQAQAPRDLDKHANDLIGLASQSDSILEITKRRESTAFLLAGITRRLPCERKECRTDDGGIKCQGICNRKGHVVSFQQEGDTLLELLHESVQKPQGRPVTFTSNVGPIDPMPSIETIESAGIKEWDMLFIDTVHTGTRAMQELLTLGPRTNKFIVFHDTQLYGVTGEDNQPGLLYAIKQWIESNPDWYVLHHNPDQYGLTVLSKVPEKRPEKVIRPWPLFDETGSPCGPGTELKKSLALIGITATEGCSCNARARFMDLMGPDWCTENIEIILDWLHEEANNRNMGIAFIRPAARIMVKRAIASAERLIKKGLCR